MNLLDGYDVIGEPDDDEEFDFVATEGDFTADAADSGGSVVPEIVEHQEYEAPDPEPTDILGLTRGTKVRGYEVCGYEVLGGSYLYGTDIVASKTEKTDAVVEELRSSTSISKKRGVYFLTTAIDRLSEGEMRSQLEEMRQVLEESSADPLPEKPAALVREVTLAVLTGRA